MTINNKAQEQLVATENYQEPQKKQELKITAKK